MPLQVTALCNYRAKKLSRTSRPSGIFSADAPVSRHSAEGGIVFSATSPASWTAVTSSFQPALLYIAATMAFQIV